MANDRHTQQQDLQQDHEQGARQDGSGSDAIDGLANKKPDELTPDELRLMADTMPGDGPGDD